MLRKFMNRVLKIFSIVCIAISCSIISISFPKIHPASTMQSVISKSLVSIDVAQAINFEKHFQELGIEGSILIYDFQSDRTYQYNAQRNKNPFLPASTFKILNSLISLETGIIKDEIAILTWDGISRQIPEWNRDLNMRQAFGLSAVWFYQVLARRVGYERMQEWVAKADYGNQNIGSPKDIDTFWLTGELRITPQEQIQFLNRLYNNDLPFSEKSLSTVKDIMILEQTPDYTIRGKTGWASFEEETTPGIGWYIGYLEKQKDVYFFSTNIDIRDENDLSARIDLTRRCFKELELL